MDGLVEQGRMILSHFQDIYVVLIDGHRPCPRSDLTASTSRTSSVISPRVGYHYPQSRHAFATRSRTTLTREQTCTSPNQPGRKCRLFEFPRRESWEKLSTVVTSQRPPQPKSASLNLPRPQPRGSKAPKMARDPRWVLANPVTSSRKSWRR